MVGRFDNPFFTVSRMIWEDEIGFDGIAIQARYEIANGVTPFMAAGAFPVFNTDFNFATNQPAKFKSVDKYLYAVQGGVDFKLSNDVNVKVGAAYYDYVNIEGKLSDPFTPLNSSDAGNTDDTRPSFAQNGNTYMALRNIVPTADNGFGTTNQFQYFGLATPFRVLAFTGKIDINHFEPCQISLFGEYARNTAFNADSINAVAVNNRGPNSATGGTGTFVGGNTAYIVGLQFGKPAFEKRWDWNATINYRYVESDAIVDGFTDSDFGVPLYGTNLKGWTAGAAVALSPRVKLGLRWMSANSVAGPSFKSDLLQFDISAKF